MESPFSLQVTISADRSCPDDKDKARNAANRPKGSKFALAVIQTLLDTSVNNYQSVL